MIHSHEMEGEMQWRRFYHGLTNEESEDEEVTTKMSTAKVVRTVQAHACSEYVINSHEGIQEELMQETHYSQEYVDEEEFEKNGILKYLKGMEQ